MGACCGRRVLASVDGDDDGGDVRDVDALVEADARAREALEAAEEVVRVKITVEAALRRGFMALARAMGRRRWDDGARSDVVVDARDVGARARARGG